MRSHSQHCLVTVLLSAVFAIGLTGCESSQQTDITEPGAPAAARPFDVVRAMVPTGSSEVGQSEGTLSGMTAQALEPSIAAANTKSGESDSIVIKNTNVSGGGFQSDVTITEDGQTVYSAADVSGVFKSIDGGVLFDSRNKGLESNKVASLAITPDNDQILYAGTGNKGTSGGLFRSLDGGENWVLTNAGVKARFAGNHSASGDPVPRGHPRSNGDLIVVDEGNSPDRHDDDIVIAGTYKDGIRLFEKGGDVEASAVNTSGFVRSIARHAALPGTAFAAIQFAEAGLSGIYMIDYTDISDPTSTLEYATPRPEGVTVLSNGHVYGAIGSKGIVKYDGSSWKLQNSGLSIDDENRQWTAVTGYVSNAADVVYAGTTNLGGSAKGTFYSNIWRTVDSGESWSALVDAKVNVSDTIHGQTHDWWFRTDAFTQAGLGRMNSVVSAIAVSRSDDEDSVADDIIYVSGRGGIWKSGNGGNSWEPAVNNMRATANNGIAINPNNPDQMVLANTDFVVLETSSGFEGNDMSRDKPRDAESRGYDVVFDAVSDELILGAGDRDTNNPGGGEVFVKSANALGKPSGDNWTNTGLSSATARNNGRVRAVAYGYHDGTAATSQTILAAVEGDGVFRYHEGEWTKSGGITIGATKRSNFVWPDSGSSGVVYLLDLSNGLYRSKDGGQNWENIWPEMILRNKDFYNSGYITAHDDDPTTLYVSIQGDRGSPIGADFGVYRLSGADNRVFGAPGTSGITDLTRHSGNSPILRPGPLAFGPNGSLFLTQQQDSKNATYAALFYMGNPTNDTSFTDLTSVDYRNTAVTPSGMEVSTDGHLYISQNGLGIVKIRLPCRLVDTCD